MTAACCLNLSKHSIIHTAATVWVSQLSVGVKKKKKKKPAIWLVDGDNSTLLECDLWGCTDRCTYWPFAHLSCSVNLLCALMLRRKMQ